MESEALQRCILKFVEDRKKLRTSVEIFVDWMDDRSPPWSTYREFVSDYLIALDKQPGVHIIVVGETWRLLFVKCVLRVTGPESTKVCQDEHICARLKAGIDGAIHGVQFIWDNKLTTEDWGFVIVDTKTLLTISI